MFHHALPDFFAVCLIFFAAGAVKGVLGMGLPTVAMGLLGLAMPVAAAASLLAVPSLVTNVWQAVAGPGLAGMVRRLWPMQAGIATGVAAAALAFPAAQAALGQHLLGACLAAYGALGLSGWRAPRPPAAWETPAGVLAGISTGVVTGLTGVFVLPAVPYLQALGLGKDALAQALGLCFTTATLALGAVLAAQGHLGAETSLASALAVLPAVAGMLLGQALRKGMSEALFRRCFFGGLLALGMWLLAR